jgi:bacteriocin biosynthesis cyclodehydratase domain-containing protein
LAIVVDQFEQVVNMPAIRQRSSITQIRRPAFKPNLHIEILPGEGVFILSENDSFVWEGEHAMKVIPLINGLRTIKEIAKALQKEVAPQHVYRTIDRLLCAGQIEEANPSIPPEIGAFWSEMNVVSWTLPQLFTTSVRIVALDDINPRPLASAVESFGIRVAKRGRFMVVLVNDYLSPEIETLNASRLAKGLPWMIIKPNGVNLWLGPIFVPGRTACWGCLAHRLRNNREVESYIQRKKGLTQPFPVSRAKLGLTQSQAYAMAAVQIARWLATGTNSALESKLLVAETITFGFNSHIVVRRPQCPDCGNPHLARTHREMMPLKNRGIFSSTDNGSRTEPPEITFERFRHHISPITGIVRGIYPSSLHATGPVRTYTAGHNFAMKSDSLYFLKSGLRTLSSGKGKSDAQARTSALCEALERYSGVFQNDEERITGSFRELHDEAIHPNACMLFSETQYHEREASLSRGSLFQNVPREFDESAQIEWSPVYSYSQKRKKYLPTSYLYYGYPGSEKQSFAISNSNGNAAGVTFEDACLQGVLELIERDSVCLWWYNQLRCPKIDLDSFNDPYFRELREYYASLGREFWVLDLTSDIQVPAFAAITRRHHAATEDIVIGFGAHLNAHIGVSRAITEMNQFLPMVLNVGRNGATAYSIKDRGTVSWWRTATLDNCPYLRPLPRNSTKSITKHPPITSGNTRDQLVHCFQILEKLGMEILLLDQTRADIGLTVVKVIVPGLRHFWPRFAPGRLYDVPVRLGWLKKTIPEAKLNPIPMPF